MEQEKSKQNGIKIKWIYRGIIPVIVVLCAALFLVAMSTNRSFETLEKVTEQYIKARKDCADMQAGSDYLTDRVRTFIVTGDTKSIEDFFYEVEVTKRRDLAVQNLEEILPGSEIVDHMHEALEASNQLAEIEHYAMSLAVTGYGINRGTLPSALQTVKISEKDSLLPAEKQLDRAREMVFDETYQLYKSNIRSSLELCEQGLIRETESAQKSSTLHLERLLTFQTLLVALVFVGAVLIALFNLSQVMEPINALVQAIQEKQPAEERGAHELRIVSRSYNSSLEQNKQYHEALAYQADHDALTGVLNRGGFEKAREITRGRAQALIIIDVDYFKQFNDTYGHDVGDKILQKVGKALKANFREEDYVCRYGGDEFIVIMVHANSSMRHLVTEKIKKIQSTLRDLSDGLPLITISVGVAFSDRPDPSNDILKDADTALYITKEHGHDGCTFYGDKIKEDEKMLTIDNLKDFGADVKEGLDRCMNNEAFYLRLVRIASQDANFGKLEDAITHNDLEAAFEAAHALKGVLANLSLTPILTPVSEMTELLRVRKEQDYGPYLKKIRDSRDDLLAICKD